MGVFVEKYKEKEKVKGKEFVIEYVLKEEKNIVVFFEM